MSSPLLALTLIFVLWLAIWAVKDHSRPSKTWWPFAMREPVAMRTKPRHGLFRRGRRAPGAGEPAQTAWRRSGS